MFETKLKNLYQPLADFLTLPSMKKWFRYLFYASLVFLVIALIRADYLVIPHIYDPVYLVISLVLLLAGFLLSGASWASVLNQAGYRITFGEGITATGLSIFGKYIPGKIWVIMGRAEYLTGKFPGARKDLASFSFDAQFIALWVALLLGTIGMISIGSINIYGAGVLILLILLSLVIYTPLFHRVASFVLSRILNRPVKVPKLPFLKMPRVLFWYLMNWGAWCMGFYFLAAALIPQTIPLDVSLAFGLAGSLGILVIFAPGGLGIREGILTGYLTIVGLDLQDATTIAVASRLWFLVGEVFIFLLAMIINRGKNAYPEAA